MNYIRAKEIDDNRLIICMAKFLEDPGTYHPEYFTTLTEEYKRRIQEKFKEFLPQQNNTTMNVKRVIPDKKSNLIHASVSDSKRCVFFNETKGVVGVANEIPNGYYVQWADNTSSSAYQSFNLLVESMGSLQDRIIITQIEGY